MLRNGLLSPDRPATSEDFTLYPSESPATSAAGEPWQVVHFKMAGLLRSMQRRRDHGERRNRRRKK